MRGYHCHAEDATGLDEATADWRAVCGKTARTVRREGGRKAGRARLGAAGSQRADEATPLCAASGGENHGLSKIIIDSVTLIRHDFAMVRQSRQLPPEIMLFLSPIVRRGRFPGKAWEQDDGRRPQGLRPSPFAAHPASSLPEKPDRPGLFHP